MIDIVQLAYGADNLGYLVCGGRTALCVDGGAVEAILGTLAARRLRLAGIVSTHGHHDHTQGNAALAVRTGAPILDHLALARDGGLELDGEEVRALATPGHTRDSVVLLAGDAALTGDTLFNGTIGNCFSGDFDALRRSIEILRALPASTRVLAGHDYLDLAIAFARRLEPGNRAAQDRLAAARARHPLFTTIGEELAANPYLRFDHPDLVARVRATGGREARSPDPWRALMSVE